MYRTQKKLVLGSGSPRRKQFLVSLGLDFVISPSSLDETRYVGESPRSYVERMAAEKARGVSTVFPQSWVLTADTIVHIDDEIFSKPPTVEAAVSMLCSLSGKVHLVTTAFSLACLEQDVIEVRQVTTEVHFTHFSKEVAVSYAHTGEGLDKAGSYGIQGKGGCLVERINGSYSNVVGLPLVETIAALMAFGIITPVGPNGSETRSDRLL